jgi:L-serine dehydratase
MRAAGMFARELQAGGQLDKVVCIQVELYGSLGATGKGHGSDKALILGLEGEAPETVDTDAIPARLEQVHADGQLRLLGEKPLDFELLFHRRKVLPYHPNGLIFHALDSSGQVLGERTYYSVGGGFVVNEAAAGADRIVEDQTLQEFPFASAEELLALCAEHGLSISEIMLRNELAWRTEAGVRAELEHIWTVMQDCVTRGCRAEGVLPGGLQVKRRAARLFRQLTNEQAPSTVSLGTMDWVNLYALAVNEENAAGGRVVTAPTNGAAGIIPAVLHYYWKFAPGHSTDGIIRFLLTAGAICILYKENASISGAEVGCQGEVGSACSMAAAALTEVLGGTPEQVENAAEIAMEHNLGLTCDPVGGLVQVPCIERNAMGAVKAINASRMALRGDGTHFVSLDKVIKTMRETGADMKTKYKETARGGLAVNVIEC